MLQTLVAETLVLAKTHGCVEKIESELEEELRRESKGQDSDPLTKSVGHSNLPLPLFLVSPFPSLLLLLRT